jgi:hypothetical protein
LHHVWVTKGIGAGADGDHWSRCRHLLWLQLPLRLSLIQDSWWHLQWICNECEDFSISDGGWVVFKTTRRSGRTSNARCRDGYNTTCWVSLWGSTRLWCAVTACTQHSSWSLCWPSLCSTRGRSHALSDVCNESIVQPRWRGGVHIINWRGYGTRSSGWMPAAISRRNATPRWGNQITPCWHILLLLLNISYNWSCAWVQAVGRHSPIQIFDIRNVEITSSLCFCNRTWGRLLFEWPGRDLNKMGGALQTTLGSQSRLPMSLVRNKMVWNAQHDGISCY